MICTDPGEKLWDDRLPPSGEEVLQLSVSYNLSILSLAKGVVSCDMALDNIYDIIH